MPKRYLPPNSAYKDSLFASMKEGVTAEMTVRIADYYLIPFALLLGASETWIGFMVATQNIVSALALLAVPLITVSLKSRLTMINKGIALQCAALVPIGFLFLVPSPWNLVLLLLLVTSFRTVGAVIGPAWGSLVSEYLLPKQRGLYFGGRSQVIGIAGMTAAFLGGLFLACMQKNFEMASFLVIFLLAALFRFVSLLFSRQMADITHPEGHPRLDTYVHSFVSHFKDRNFMHFCLFQGCMTFAIQLVTPFFAVWLLKDLHLSYFWYTAVLLSSSVGSFISFPAWGKHADHFGNVRIVRYSAFLIAMVPLSWIIARDHALLLVILELFTGFVNAGFNLSSTNYVYDASHPRKRMECLIFLNFLNAVMLFSGAALGGFLLNRIPATLGSTYITLFIVSIALRLACAVILSHRFIETRTVKKAANMKLFMSVVGIRPIVGQNDEWDLHADYDYMI